MRRGCRAVENDTLLCGKRDKEVDGFGVEHVVEAVRPFLVFKLYRATFIFCGVANSVEL